jgi:hypothetical protein
VHPIRQPQVVGERGQAPAVPLTVTPRHVGMRASGHHVLEVGVLVAEQRHRVQHHLDPRRDVADGHHDRRRGADSGERIDRSSRLERERADDPARRHVGDGAEIALDRRSGHAPPGTP